MLITRIALVVFCGLLLGCGSAATYEARTSAKRTAQDVRTIIARHLDRSPGSIRPDATFSQLGADDLDLVEIVLEVEDSLGIAIDDEKLTRAGGADEFDQLPTRLTVAEFERVVNESAR
jgi:acyl carrier protein